MSAINSQADAPTRLRPIQWVGIALAAILLTGFFAVLRFPYERVVNALGASLESESGVTFRVDEIGPSVSLRGPGLGLSQLGIDWASGETLRLDEVGIYPGWSLWWLRAIPTYYVKASGPIGELAGNVGLSEGGGFDGRVTSLDLSAIPLEKILGELSLTGMLTADVDFIATGAEEGATHEGELDFEILQGSVTLPGIPVGLPFQTLSGHVVFGGEHAARIESMSLDGPVARAEIQGTVGLAPQAGNEPLDIHVELTVEDANIRNMVQRSGVRFDRAGTAKIRVAGTLAHPVTR